MAAMAAICPWGFLAKAAASSPPSSTSSPNPNDPSFSLTPQRKSFAQALQNSYDMPYLSSTSMLKGRWNFNQDSSRRVQSWIGEMQKPSSWTTYSL